MIHRTMIIPASHVELARTLATLLAGPAGDGMWTTELSVTGVEPATHYISTGLISEEFAELLPLQEYIYSDELQKEIAQYTLGNPEAIYELANNVATLDAIIALLDAAIVTTESWEQTCSREGLKPVQSTLEIL